MKRFILATALLAGITVRADDPELLARDFVALATKVANLKGPANFTGYRERQKQAIEFYKEFLEKHPDSVYTNTVRWSLHTAYLAIDKRKEAAAVLDEIQDSLVQELLKVSYAQRNLGNTGASKALVEAFLADKDDGGVRARAAEFLYLMGETERATKILDEVTEEKKYPEEIRARALLIKADLHRFPKRDISYLRDLVRRFPDTKAAEEGRRKLRAALLAPGSEAIPFEVETVDGKTITLSSLRGKAVLLYFFATWSYPSWRDLKELKKTVDALPRGSCTVIVAACETYVQRPRKFLSSQGISWPLVAEGNKWRNSLALLYDVTSLPYYVLIDKNGMVVTLGTLKVSELAPLLTAAATE